MAASGAPTIYYYECHSDNDSHRNDEYHNNGNNAAYMNNVNNTERTNYQIT